MIGVIKIGNIGKNRNPLFPFFSCAIARNEPKNQAPTIDRSPARMSVFTAGPKAGSAKIPEPTKVCIFEGNTFSGIPREFVPIPRKSAKKIMKPKLA